MDNPVGRDGSRLSHNDFNELETLFDQLAKVTDLSINIVQESGTTAQNREYSVILKSKKPASARSPTAVAQNVNELMITKLNQIKERMSSQSGPSSVASPGIPGGPVPSVMHLPTLALPSVGSTVKAVVVYAPSPNDVFLVLRRDEDDFYNIQNRVSFNSQFGAFVLRVEKRGEDSCVGI